MEATRMRTMRLDMRVTAALLVAVAGWAGAQEPPAEIQAITTYEFGQTREPLTVVEDMVAAAASGPDHGAALAEQLAAVLALEEATGESKRFVCRQLAVIGTPEQVDALRPMLTDAEWADEARYALEGIPGPEVNAALVEALDPAPVEAMPGLLTSLGRRGAARYVDEIATWTTSVHFPTAEAAIHALGLIGTADAADALLEHRPLVSSRVTRDVADALLLAAESLKAEGRAAEAATIYEALSGKNEEAAVRAAAFRGRVETAGSQAPQRVLEALRGDDPAMRLAGLKLVRNLPGAEVTAAFAEALPGLSPELQGILVGVLAERGHEAAKPAVRQALDSEHAGVRVAALEAMAELGAAEDVTLLAERAASTEGAEREAARDSLEALAAPGVEQAIVSALGAAGPGAQAELARAVAARGLTEAVPALVEAAKQADQPESARAAIEALGDLAGPRELPDLLELAVAAPEAVRAEVESALMQVALRAPAEERLAPVIDAYDAATDVGVRALLIRVLGEIGDDRALDLLRIAAQGQDASLRDEAVRTLAQWPTHGARRDLIGIARDPAEPGHKVLALRGYVRLLNQAGDMPVEQRLSAYREALEIAEGADAQGLVLSGLGEVHHPQSLELLAQMMAEPALRDEAALAGLKAARALAAAAPEEARAFMERVQGADVTDNAKQLAADSLGLFERFGDFVAAWEVSGPYTREGANHTQLYDVVFAPEEGGANDWRLAPADIHPERPGLIMLDRLMGGANRAAYLRTALASPAEQPARFLLGSDDGLKVWLNGELVHGNNATRSLSPGQDAVEVMLEEGLNAVLVKVTQGGGEWAVCLQIQGPEGQPLPEVRASPFAD